MPGPHEASCRTLAPGLMSGGCHVHCCAGAGPQTSPRPVKKTRREREFDAAAAAALTAPVVVRQPASDAERREVDK